MYQVILVNDEVRNKNYFYSYTETDENVGNITVDDLPSYADINKARSCFYENNTWIFDEDKYQEILAVLEEEKEKAEEEKAKSEAALSNEEIAEALMELADLLTVIEERVSALEEV
ncbi:MAG: hypothetical protein MJZ37_08100 [Bacilli bacterium]|nr:hypothetical protein [Bacilli bacterium]